MGKRIGTLAPEYGCTTMLVDRVRSRRTRRLPVTLRKSTDGPSYYDAYLGSKYVGYAVIRSPKARRTISTGTRPYLTIGWTDSRNEVLEVTAP